MSYVVVSIKQYQSDLLQNVPNEDRNTVRRRAEALATNRTGARLAGPLQEYREITVLKRYIITYRETPGQEKVILLGVRRKPQRSH